jgi:hypothetical protein
MRLMVAGVACMLGCDGGLGQSPDGSLARPTADASIGPIGGPAPDAGVNIPLDAGGGMTADAGTMAPPDAGQPVPDAGADNACGNALLCERFDTFPVRTIKDGDTLGLWKAQLDDSTGAAKIDNSKAYSGANSLKMHISAGSNGGGRLRTGEKPLFASTRSHLYGRFMLWHTSNKSSVHWTMFGLSGKVGPGNPLSGHDVTYLFGANRANQFWSVYYDNQTGMDCSKAGTTTIPLGKWSCIQWEADSDARKIDMWVNGTLISDLAVRDKGRNCVNAARDSNTPWYGPQSSSFYIGADSFHPMDGDLDLWIDDVIVDTKTVPCP